MNKQIQSLHNFKTIKTAVFLIVFYERKTVQNT
jgi:hypothetical protein